MSDRSEPLAELRRRRADLLDREDRLSYVRRVAQARADLVRDALLHDTGGDPTPVYGRGDLTGGLRDVLGDRLLGGDGRPPRDTADYSDDPRAEELDRLCAEHGFNRMDMLGRDALERLLDELDAFERSVSSDRRTVFGELDAVTELVVDAYRQEHGDAHGDEHGDEHGDGPAASQR